MRKNGIYEVGKYKGSINGVHTLEKEYWSKMIERAHSGRTWKLRPSYEGCSCTPLFNNFQLFAEWCNQQIGFGNKGWHLDKDLLFKGNKVYGENTCVFLPPTLNSLLITRKADRGNLPLGVTVRTKKTPRYVAQCNDGSGRPRHLGQFATPEEAFSVYKEYKEARIKTVAKEFRIIIDPRAYETLMNYKVEITD